MWGQGGEMNQALYAHMNNKRKMKKINKERRMMESVRSTAIYLIYYKNFCKCHRVPPVKK
jgi:hypothetical protein